MSADNSKVIQSASDEEHSRKATRVWPRMTAVICLLVFVVPLLLLRGRAEFKAIPPADRLQTMESGWGDEQRCGECHEQAETFWETGHALTLQAADSAESRKLLTSMNEYLETNVSGSSILFLDDQVIAGHIPQPDGQQNSNRFNPDAKTRRPIAGGDPLPARVQLKWCFGSGKHARTWVATLQDSQGDTDLLEYRWSWFREIDGFALSPGQPEEGTGGYFNNLGVLFDPPKARRCLGCHSSSLPITDGHIREDQIRPGVTCQRCHGPRAKHVASDGGHRENFWKNATQLESVHRCAECHRRAEEQPASDIHPANPEIARFQPVGLVQSACFKQSAMTCITCHDPHRTLKAQNSRGIWQCVQCHDGASAQRPPCAAGQTDQCVDCHMPAVSQESPLKFTDHWIRVRPLETPHQ